jgi:hypothetical protein
MYPSLVYIIERERESEIESGCAVFHACCSFSKTAVLHPHIYAMQCNAIFIHYFTIILNYYYYYYVGQMNCNCICICIWNRL